MNSEKRLKHLLRKYPSILLSLSTPIDKTNPKYPSKQPPPHSVETTPRCSPKSPASSRSSARSQSRPSRRLLRLVISEALSCGICTKLLNSPVTMECGDSFCKGCLMEKASIGGRVICPKCERCNLVDGSKCSVLVQEVVNRLVEDSNDCQESCNKISHGYKLRSRISNSIHKEEHPLATVKRKQAAKTTTRGQLTETIATFDGGQLSSHLDCTLCGRLLFDPITTQCGHTFCRGCVSRVLDYGLACPLCMTSLSLSIARDTGTTKAIEKLVQTLRRREFQERKELCKKEVEMVDEDCQMPVFICTSAFPYVACPLYVYEPRYRLLTRRCLQSPRRRFAMAAPITPSSTPGGDPNEERFAAYGTVLEVKDALYLEDGTSILTTLGIKRFKVLARGEKDGYDTATISYITDTPIPSSSLPAISSLHSRVYQKALRWVRSLPPPLQIEINQSLGTFPGLEPTWNTLTDGPAWTWWLAAVLPLSARLQVAFLSTTSLEKRLRAVDKLLERMEVRMKEDSMEVKTVSEEETCSRMEERFEGVEQRMEF